MLIPTEYIIYIFATVSIVVFIFVWLKFIRKEGMFSVFQVLGNIFLCAFISIIATYVLSIFTIGTLSTYNVVYNINKIQRYYILFSFDTPNGNKINTWLEKKYIYNNSKHDLIIKHVSYGISNIGFQDNTIAKIISPGEFYCVPDSIEDLQYGEASETIRESRMFPKRHYVLTQEF
jgi:hypothetical protein